MTLPEKYRRQAQALRDSARKDVLEAQRKADAKSEKASLLEMIADEIEKQRGLQKSERPPRVVNDMDMQAHALATSAGHSKDALVQAAVKAGYTLEQLGEQAGYSKGHLSMARRGTRSMRESATRKIQELTGFAATKANWPGGIVSGK